MLAFALGVAGFVLLIACAALSPWPWTAFGIAGGILIYLAYVNDKPVGTGGER